MVIRYRHY